ncbi:mpv17 / PMP22 family domain-containing protein [Apiospora kogelbergensis]|uniref:Mpv17 / PMP22 family domain-containing protein n=1 Tax=Apiospora kogelbergensis TaxID=1337665 RepID=A0AAW0RB54_9PEZI
MPSAMVKATLAAAALSSTSNILAQFLEAYQGQKPFAFDHLQFLRFVILTLLTCPPNYVWQQFLERSFPAYERRGAPNDVEKNQHEMEKMTEAHVGQSAGPGADAAGHGGKPKLNIQNTMAKWFIDCITLGALMNTVAFFILMGFLKGQGLGQIGYNIRNETIPLIVAGYKIWPFASIISFACIPVEKRIVFLNFVGLLWGIYMSLVAARV